MKRAQSRPVPAGEATRERILDAAETCFAEQGFGATSVRAITAAAGVNLAAVHYHFGGKEALLDAVLTRRIAPVNDERLRRLEALRRAHAPDAAPVPALLEALLEPVFRHFRDDAAGVERIARILARCEIEEPERLETAVLEHFRETGEAFLDALGEALPSLDPALVHERFRWTLGVMTHTLAWRHRIVSLPQPLPDDRPDALLQRMIVFLSAAFRAPAAAPEVSDPPNSPSRGEVS